MNATPEDIQLSQHLSKSYDKPPDFHLIRKLVAEGARLDIMCWLVVKLAAYHGDLELMLWLISQGANLGATDCPIKYVSGTERKLIQGYITDGTSALYFAVVNDQIEIVKLLLEHEVDVTAYGNSALKMAAYHGNVEMIDLLMAHGADPSSDPEYEVSIYEPSLEKRDQICEVVFRKRSAKIFYVDAQSNNSALILAVAGKQEHVILKFLQEGLIDAEANISALNLAGRIAYRRAIEILLPECPDLKDVNLLSGFINFNDLDGVRDLIQRGADIHAYYETALRIAIDRGYLDIADELISQGADAHKYWPESFNCYSLVKDVRVLKFMASHGYDLHAEEECLMVRACLDSQLDTVRLLMDPDVKLDTYCEYLRNTPLSAAVTLGNFDLVQDFIKAGATISFHNEIALKKAAKRADFKIVEFLILNGADPLCPGVFRNVALRGGHKRYSNDLTDSKFQDIIRERADIIRLLIDLGCDLHTDDDVVLRASACIGPLDLIKYLVEKGANVKACNYEALRLTKYKREIREYLLQQCSDPEAVKLLDHGYTCQYGGWI